MAVLYEQAKLLAISCIIYVKILQTLFRWTWVTCKILILKILDTAYSVRMYTNKTDVDLRPKNFTYFMTTFYLF